MCITKVAEQYLNDETHETHTSFTIITNCDDLLATLLTKTIFIRTRFISCKLDCFTRDCLNILYLELYLLSENLRPDICLT
jgi:hypothetical protein